MADQWKQNGGGGLNGAFYGPTIAPDNRRSYGSIGRGGSCCCTPCSLLCSLFKLLFSVVLVLGILVLVFWLVFRPSELKSYAENATLTSFNLTGNDSISYDLALDLSIRNPNRRVALYYDRVVATASYDGTRFSYDRNLPTFFQHHKNTTTIHPSFVGSKVAVSDSFATFYASDKADGFFYIDVRVDMKVRLKIWFVKTNKYSPKIKCSLKLPAPATSGEFSRTKCDVDFF